MFDDESTAMPRVTVRYFARVRELAGCAQEDLACPAETDDATLLRLIGEHRPAIADRLDTCRLAHNHAFARGAIQLREGDELAVIPPVSGG